MGRSVDRSLTPALTGQSAHGVLSGVDADRVAQYPEVVTNVELSFVIADYVKNFCNPGRRHGPWGYLTPNEFGTHRLNPPTQTLTRFS
jgi:hypothetical protein